MYLIQVIELFQELRTTTVMESERAAMLCPLSRGSLNLSMTVVWDWHIKHTNNSQVHRRDSRAMWDVSVYVTFWLIKRSCKNKKKQNEKMWEPITRHLVVSHDIFKTLNYQKLCHIQFLTLRWNNTKTKKGITFRKKTAFYLPQNRLWFLLFRNVLSKLNIFC